jgi:hypothetical protein
LCLACLERALETKEAAPEDAKAHYQQAVWSLVCGIGGWAFCLLGTVMLIVGLEAGPNSAGIAWLLPAMLCLGLSLLFPAPGIGLAAVAIRARGDHLILATAGLVLSCLQIGAILGFFGLASWRS